MRRFRAALFGSVCLALLAGCGEPEAPGGLSLEAAWIEPSPAGAGPAGGFLTVRNGSDRPRTLRSASSPAAARVEIHRSWLDEQGVARMARLETVEIPARGELRLTPGGHHLMLFGAEALTADAAVTLRLGFDGDERLEIAASVRPAGGHAGHPEHGGHAGDAKHAEPAGDAKLAEPAGDAKHAEPAGDAHADHAH